MQNLLMQSQQKVGIVGYGAYIPRYRLPGTEISSVWTNGLRWLTCQRKSRRRIR